MMLVGMCFSFGGGLAVSLYFWSADRLFCEFGWMTFRFAGDVYDGAFVFAIWFCRCVCCRFLYLSVVYMVELISFCRFGF